MTWNIVSTEKLSRHELGTQRAVMNEMIRRGLKFSPSPKDNVESRKSENRLAVSNLMIDEIHNKNVGKLKQYRGIEFVPDVVGGIKEAASFVHGVIRYILTPGRKFTTKKNSAFYSA